MAMESTNVEIKVQPEVLDAKALEVSSAVRQMEEILETILRTVKDTKNYWVGEAGDLHREAFQEQKNTMETLLKRLGEHPVDLQKIAKTYRDTEMIQANSMDWLSSNLID